MVNNTMATRIANIMKEATGLVEFLDKEDGSSFNVPEEKRAEFKSQFQKQGVEKLKTELKEKMEELKNATTKANATN